jgi:hypothetical protein
MLTFASIGINDGRVQYVFDDGFDIFYPLHSTVENKRRLIRAVPKSNL